jgi:hypothetical protein
MIVKATREGLCGELTASGWRIDAERMFVALPSHRALFRWVIIANPLNKRVVRAQVLDVGPWNIDDDDYVFGTARPLSESGIKTDGKKRISGETNGAGIDLGEAVWAALGMTDNGEVSWSMEMLPGEVRELAA